MRPVNVFIHGGAWRAGLARDYAFPAEMFVGAGSHFVVLDFNNVLETGGDLMVDGRSGAARRRLGDRQRQAVRRRPSPRLRLGHFVRRAPRRRGSPPAASR